jgi:AcrR family transcriptional regulator
MDAIQPAGPATPGAKSLADENLPPRARIVAAARALFYRQGIKSVGVDAIAEAAGTNKMTLYRHFTSKDELVAECLRQTAAEGDRIWAMLEAAYPDDAKAQLRGWLQAVGAHIAEDDGRGCALANAAVELPERQHPARCVIEECKMAQRAKLAALCAKAGLTEPDMLADELFMLLEGARVCSQSMGPSGPGARLTRAGEALIAAHEA